MAHRHMIAAIYNISIDGHLFTCVFSDGCELNILNYACRVKLTESPKANTMTIYTALRTSLGHRFEPRERLHISEELSEAAREILTLSA